MKQDTYLIRNKNDGNLFHIGIKTTPSKYRGVDEYCIWASIFIDGVDEIFGVSVSEIAKDMKLGQIIPINIHGEIKWTDPR